MPGLLTISTISEYDDPCSSVTTATSSTQNQNQNYAVANDTQRLYCPSCRAPSSLRRMKQFLKVHLRCFCIGSGGPSLHFRKRHVWKCGLCGWLSEPGWHPPTLTTGKVGGPGTTTTELNPLYRTAEAWHRPPDAVLGEQSQTMRERFDAESIA